MSNPNQEEMFSPSELEEQARIEAEAREFATITSEARAMLPIMMMAFKVRIKGSDFARSLTWSIPIKSYQDRARALCGKELLVTIDWSLSSHNMLVLRIVEEGVEPSLRQTIMLSEREVTRVLTLNNNTPRLLRMWEEITAAGVSNAN